MEVYLLLEQNILFSMKRAMILIWNENVWYQKIRFKKKTFHYTIYFNIKNYSSYRK